MKCPRCGADATGAFCSNCGSALQTPSGCLRCGAQLPDGARFCTQCGARASGTAGWLRYAFPAGLVVVALIAGYALGRDEEDGAPDPATTQAPFAASGASRGAPPPLTGSMRDQADRLFERIMQARARGDTADARFFLPMALQAYQGAEPLDADGLFHLGLLQLEGGRTDDATRTAARIGELDANHLFGFALTGEAAIANGDESTARRAFRDFLDRFEDEIARSLPEYEMHRPALDEYRERAEQVTRG